MKLLAGVEYYIVHVPSTLVVVLRECFCQRCGVLILVM